MFFNLLDRLIEQIQQKQDEAFGQFYEGIQKSSVSTQTTIQESQTHYISPSVPTTSLVNNQQNFKPLTQSKSSHQNPNNHIQNESYQNKFQQQTNYEYQQQIVDQSLISSIFNKIAKKSVQAIQELLAKFQQIPTVDEKQHPKQNQKPQQNQTKQTIKTIENSKIEVNTIKIQSYKKQAVTIQKSNNNPQYQNDIETKKLTGSESKNESQTYQPRNIKRVNLKQLSKLQNPQLKKLKQREKNTQELYTLNSQPIKKYQNDQVEQDYKDNQNRWLNKQTLQSEQLGNDKYQNKISEISYSKESKNKKINRELQSQTPKNLSHQSNQKRQQKNPRHLQKSLNIRKPKIFKLNPQATNQQKQKRMKENQKKMNANIQFLDLIRNNIKIKQTPQYKQFKKQEEDLRQLAASLRIKSFKKSNFYLESTQIKSHSKKQLLTITNPKYQKQQLTLTGPNNYKHQKQSQLENSNIFHDTSLNLFPPIQKKNGMRPKPYSIYNIHQKHNELFTNIPLEK